MTAQQLQEKFDELISELDSLFQATFEVAQKNEIDPILESMRAAYFDCEASLLGIGEIIGTVNNWQLDAEQFE